MAKVQLSGSCLCGKCNFEAEADTATGGACHCGMCRKWSGGILTTVECGSSVKFADGAPTGTYRASEWGERIFCRGCGSSLVWQTQDGNYQHVSMQAFDDPEQFDLTMQVFIDQKPGNYALANETKTMTEAEVFAMFAPTPEDQK